MKIKNKIKEWIKRYWLSELVSYTLAMLLSFLTFKLTRNYYLSGILLIVGDYLGYFGIMLLNEIKNTIKVKMQYSLKLLIKDVRNLGFEFGPPQILEIFIIYPLLTFYIPPLFKNYFIGAFVAMTLAVIIFYIQTVILYEIRKKIFKD
ncbi:MAG: hypothetical protein PHE25_02390 [Candidatus Gracilibacteria bacterium]|nr:hypothetical protein [Candidatus Gracilibacteria bacterium]